MDEVEELGPKLALAFTCIAAVGSSMVRRFCIEDAKSCTRVCRRILLCATPPSPAEVTGNVCGPTCLHALATATTLLRHRLCQLDATDMTNLRIAEAAIEFLRQDLTSAAAVALQSS